MREPDSEPSLSLRYRSERGLFLRTYYLVVEAESPGEGPASAGELFLRRLPLSAPRLAWRRPRPAGGGTWRDRIRSPELASALKQLQVERLALRWRPERRSWLVELETLLGSVTVTFLPPLETPNPVRPEEARAVLDLVAAVGAAVRP